MELHKLKIDDVKGWDQARMRETEGEIRHALAKLRMDIYTARASHAAKARGLRKGLARLLTEKSMQRLANPAPKAEAKASQAGAKAGKPKAARKQK